MLGGWFPPGIFAIPALSECERKALFSTRGISLAAMGSWGRLVFKAKVFWGTEGVTILTANSISQWMNAQCGPFSLLLDMEAKNSMYFNIVSGGASKTQIAPALLGRVLSQGRGSGADKGPRPQAVLRGSRHCPLTHQA